VKVKEVKALPQQTSLALEDPAKGQYDACRAEYMKLLVERRALDTRLAQIANQGKALKARLAV